MELGFEASEEILLYSIYVVLALKIAVLGIVGKYLTFTIVITLSGETETFFYNLRRW